MSLVTLLEKLNQVPPVIMRALAARKGKALSPDEIASKSGLSRSTVQRISSRRTWDGVTIRAACQFSYGCGFDLQHMKVVLKRVRDIQEKGLSGLKHMQVSSRSPLYRRGAVANQIKFINKVITSE